MAIRRLHRRLSLVPVLGAVLLAAAGAVLAQSSSPPLDAFGDDTFLVATSAAPNVILLLDNSDSMNAIEWHPDFDPEAPETYDCDAFDNDTIYAYTADTSETHCGSGSRTIYAPNDPTYWDGRYLNWYFGLDNGADAAILDEIATARAEVEGCTQSGGAKFFDEKYRRTRFEASKQVLLDLLCVAETKNVRFGLALLRAPADVAGVDPNGGLVVTDLGRSNPNHAAELESTIKNAPTVGEGSPLSEALFQIYTFWMSRSVADLPSSDQNGDSIASTFPAYWYDKFGTWEPINSTQWLEDPMLYECEKAFVIIVTDGLPSRDDFDQDPVVTSQGFASFPDLIGDYYAPVDPDTLLNIDPDDPEVPGDAEETSLYLDDIAKYMYDNDFRPDLGGDQTIDTYTVALAADAATEAYLRRTAELGNGNSYAVQDGDALAFALIAALNDIIEKSASFTAATVPSARTTDGADFYQSYFFPRSSSAFWEGHVRSWQITAIGDIHDANGDCALDDPTPGECNSGPFKPDAEYFWDAAEEVPPPGTDNSAGNRQLYVSKGASRGAVPPDFDLTLTAADLDLADFAVAGDPAPNSPLYPVMGSTALNEEGLADEIVAFVRGCFFGTGAPTNVATPSACLPRPARLGDIFHSNPVMVRRPSLSITDGSYVAFKNHYATRSRRLMAGTNAGFLEALDAGSWDPVAARYDAGTGEEVFGFMPWEARTKIKNLPIDSATDRNHYVDGDASVADVWFYGSDTQSVKNPNGSEWHTVLIGSLREGGHHYYALDVTNPDGIIGAGNTPAIGYPEYLWEFPSESDPDGDLGRMGETWARPIMTRIRVNLAGNTYERHVAIVTAGYDPVSDPNPFEVRGTTRTYDAAETNGRAIYVLDVKTGKVIAEKRFSATAGDAQADMKYAIVGAPAVYDLNSDGFADVIYFVDMGGQVFKWAIRPVGEDRANDGLGERSQPSWPFELFFTAPVTDISGTDYFKNIFFAPAGALVNGSLYIAFGTGERRNLGYPGAPGEDENNRFYVIKDPTPLIATGTTLTEADLTDITGDEDGALITNSGFFFRVADGEKFVTNVEIFAGHVIAATFAPSPPGANPCTTRGEGALYVFDIRNGEGFFQDGNGDPMRGLAIGAGLPTDPKVSVGVGGTNNRVIIEKSGADLESLEAEDIDVTGGLLYWRER